MTMSRLLASFSFRNSHLQRMIILKIKLDNKTPQLIINLLMAIKHLLVTSNQMEMNLNCADQFKLKKPLEKKEGYEKVIQQPIK